MITRMTDTYDGPVEVITSVRRRRRWTTEEKVRIVEETSLPGNFVSLVARRHGIAGNQLFTWRRLMAQGALTAAGAGEEVVPASEYRAAQQQIRELQRLLGNNSGSIAAHASSDNQNSAMAHSISPARHRRIRNRTHLNPLIGFGP